MKTLVFILGLAGAVTIIAWLSSNSSGNWWDKFTGFSINLGGFNLSVRDVLYLAIIGMVLSIIGGCIMWIFF